MTTSFVIGYRKGEIEPKIAPLVEAVQRAGFVTFSSCEGHADDESRSQYTCVVFYAHEHEARCVHEIFLRYRSRLACSWVLSGAFVAHRETNEWVLGWALENCGIIESVDRTDFASRTVEAGWADIPLLIDMFAELRAAGATP